MYKIRLLIFMSEFFFLVVLLEQVLLNHLTSAVGDHTFRYLQKYVTLEKIITP
jgi:hypothetical protein